MKILMLVVYEIIFWSAYKVFVKLIGLDPLKITSPSIKLRLSSKKSTKKLPAVHFKGGRSVFTNVQQCKDKLQDIDTVLTWPTV